MRELLEKDVQNMTYREVKQWLKQVHDEQKMKRIGKRLGGESLILKHMVDLRNVHTKGIEKTRK